jgi:acetoin utilization deacetylase AcuC-like enzyme
MIGPIFYDERQSLTGVDSFSPSADKPARFMALMLQHYRPLPERPVQPVTREDLYLVHDPAHVNAVLDGRAPNGFGNTDPRVAQACLWTVGSMVSAALAAPGLLLPACSPTSGFHHAGYAFSEGYCTFNGLMVAAAKFIQANPGATVGILDCDFHYGNGTADILQRKPELRQHVVHHTAGRYFCPEGQAVEFFYWLDDAIEDLNKQSCDLVLYQAGADMHVNDPLGGLLTSKQMRERDDQVMRDVRAPLVWNLAGGYQNAPSNEPHDDPVLELHRQTMAAVNANCGARIHHFNVRHPE